MIIVKLQGGLGNQLFEYSAGLALAKKLKTELKLDVSYYENDKKRIYELDNFNISGKTANVDEIEKIQKQSFLVKLTKRFWIRNHERKIFADTYYFDKNFFNLPNNIYLDGFYNNQEYFKNIKDAVQTEFTLKNNFSQKVELLLTTIATDNSVSIHVRRGDYILPKYQEIFYPLTTEYYEQTVSLINQKVNDAHFFVFSDDIEWSKTLPFPDNTAYIEKNALGITDAEELVLMSKCKHNIIANSTFSWWGAWLNTNPDKIVIAPKKWSIYETAEKNPIPPDWIRI